MTGFAVAATADGEAAPSPDLLADAEAIVTRTRPVTAEIIAASPNLKLVQKYGGRPDRLDFDAAKEAGVAVAVMPLRGCIAVAELAMTLLLALSKQLVDGAPSDRDRSLPGSRVWNRRRRASASTPSSG